MKQGKFYSFLIDVFLLLCYINWPNFINRPHLLATLFSKICFFSYDQAFADAMKIEYLKFSNLIFLRTKRAFKRNKKLFQVRAITQRTQFFAILLVSPVAHFFQKLRLFTFSIGMLGQGSSQIFAFNMKRIYAN